MPSVDWEDKTWAREVYSPEPLQHQMDDWSCGLYTFMALSALANNQDLETKVGHDKLDIAKANALNLIMNIP